MHFLASQSEPVCNMNCIQQQLQHWNLELDHVVTAFVVLIVTALFFIVQGYLSRHPLTRSSKTPNKNNIAHTTSVSQKFSNDNTAKQLKANNNDVSGKDMPKTKIDISWLHKEILCKVFSYLDFESLLTCDLVSHNFNKTSTNPCSVSYLNFCDCFDYVNMKSINNIDRFCQIEKLEITTETKSFDAITDDVDNDKYLQLFKNTLEKSFILFASQLKNFNKIKHLRIHGSDYYYNCMMFGIEDEILESLLFLTKKNAANINILEIDGDMSELIGRIVTEPIYYNLKSMLLYLQSRNKRLNTAFKTCLKSQLTFEPKLKYLDLVSVKTTVAFWKELVDNETNMLKNVTNLRISSLEFCDETKINELQIVENEIVPQLGQMLVNLESITINCGIVSEFDTDAFSFFYLYEYLMYCVAKSQYDNNKKQKFSDINIWGDFINEAMFVSKNLNRFGATYNFDNNKGIFSLKSVYFGDWECNNIINSENIKNMIHLIAVQSLPDNGGNTCKSIISGIDNRNEKNETTIPKTEKLKHISNVQHLDLKNFSLFESMKNQVYFPNLKHFVHITALPKKSTQLAIQRLDMIYQFIETNCNANRNSSNKYHNDINRHMALYLEYSINGVVSELSYENFAKIFKLLYEVYRSYLVNIEIDIGFDAISCSSSRVTQLFRNTFKKLTKKETISQESKFNEWCCEHLTNLECDCVTTLDINTEQSRCCIIIRNSNEIYD